MLAKLSLSLIVGAAACALAGCSNDGPTAVSRQGDMLASTSPSISAATVSSLSPTATVSFESLSPGMDRANGINDAGLVVGDYGGNNVATTWTRAGGFREVRRLDGSAACCSTLTDVNAVGQASGWSFSNRGISAITWTQSTDAKTDLLVPQRAYAAGINNAGDAVGYHFDLGTRFTAFFKSATGSPVSLIPVSGAANEFAFAINNAGVIVGTSQLITAPNPSHATVWSRWDAAPTDLGTLGGLESEARAVNDGGVVVGYSQVAGGARHAMLWTAQTGMVDLHTWPNSCTGPSEAFGINNLGVIVGTCNGGPVLWTSVQGMRELPLPNGLSLGEPHAINSSNQVVGTFNGFGGALWTITDPRVAPVVTGLTLPETPVPVNTSVTASASFTDANTSDTHTAMFSWGDGQVSTAAASPDGGSGAVMGSHIYQSAGVYTVTVLVSDNSGLSDSLSSANSTTSYIVAYDPSEGFVTGGGWITSAPGSFIAEPSTTGKASFGFVSRYQKGAAAPTGNTQFQFNAGQLNFRSATYEWLVIAGPKAQYKGSGTINGAGDYGFLLTANDGQANRGGDVDRFRLKIWSRASGTVVYDNQVGEMDGANATTAITQGSIVIHKP